VVVPPAVPMGPSNPNTPHILFDSMITPLLPYAIRGAIWYQGESNEGNAADYRHLQVAMVDDWRRAWGQGDFPFCAVALAAFRNPTEFDVRSNWALLREAQLDATRSPGIGLASALDLGDAVDIHPRNKRDVGFRLAQWALVETYGRQGPAMGPRYIASTLETGAVRVRFDNVGGGLVARGGELKTVYVAGLDRTFRPATARIEGNSIVASSPEVEQPIALRYAWADNPEGCNLYNAEGLPASPFRTDDW
jgi:sialate O-acetylesterase